jgi:ketosteroid isomerase-like protein
MTTTDTAKDTVRSAWAAFASADPDRVAACFTADAEWLAPPGNATAVALGGDSHLVGRDRIVRFLTEEFPAVFVADRRADVTGVHGDGDHVVMEIRLRATLAHGGPYDNEYCFVFELDRGRIRRVREYMDTRRAAAWFAAAPSTGLGQLT